MEKIGGLFGERVIEKIFQGKRIDKIQETSHIGIYRIYLEKDDTILIKVDRKKTEMTYTPSPF